MDEAIASENLLQLLENLDKILEIFGGSRKNERIASIAFNNTLFPLSLMCNISHTKCLQEEMLVMRNVKIEKGIYGKIFKGHPLGPAKTELDLFFLNVPTVIGHSSDGKINFYVEIEMGGNVTTEKMHLVELRQYFKEKGLEMYPVLVCKQYKDWDDTLRIPIFDIEDLKKIAESASVKTLDDIPGTAYEWAGTALRILEYTASRGEVQGSKELWDMCSNLRQLDFGKFVEKGRISPDDCENFNFTFLERMNRILIKMNEKGLLQKNDKGRYELTVDGRDILGCYLGIKEDEG